MSTNNSDRVEPNEQEFAQDVKEITEDGTLTGIAGGVRPGYVSKGNAPTDKLKVVHTTRFKVPGKVRWAMKPVIKIIVDRNLAGIGGIL